MSKQGSHGDEAQTEEQMTALKRQLMARIRDRLGAEGWSQSLAARLLGTTQARISHLVNGHVDQYSIDKLVELSLRLDEPQVLHIGAAVSRSGSDLGSACLSVPDKAKPTGSALRQD